MKPRDIDSRLLLLVSTIRNTETRRDCYQRVRLQIQRTNMNLQPAVELEQVERELTAMIGG